MIINVSSGQDDLEVVDIILVRGGLRALRCARQHIKHDHAHGQCIWECSLALERGSAGFTMALTIARLHI